MLGMHVLCVNTILIYLSIKCNEIEDGGVEKLADAFIVNTTIKSFNITCKNSSLVAGLSISEGRGNK